MAIKKERDETYTVKVTRRSKVDPTIRPQKRKTGLKTLIEAQRAEKQLTEEAIREVFEREQKGDSWASIVAGFEMALRSGEGRNRVVAETTVEDYIRPLYLYTQAWWTRPAREVHRGDVRTVYEEMDRLGKSKATKEKLRTAVNQAFIWAIENRKVHGIAQSPTVGVPIVRGRQEEKEPEILKLDQIRALLDAAYRSEHPWAPIWETALLTGMRSGELYALVWENVDLDGKLITVAASYSKRTRRLGPTKGRYARRVWINPRMAEILKDLRSKAGGQKEVFPRFPDWERGEQAAILRTFCAGAGIPSVRFHALRACWATQLLQANVPPVVVMNMGGWKGYKTMQRYIRMAGIEIVGATDSLKFFDPREASNKVVELFQRQPQNQG